MDTMFLAVEAYRRGDRDVIDEMAAFLERIWPKGERPTPVEQPEVGKRYWLCDEHDTFRQVIVRFGDQDGQPWCFCASGTTFSCKPGEFPMYADAHGCINADRLKMIQRLLPREG
jgi:hypothetical protein